ncbi:MAG: HAMP domain-containing histidine kinase [Planctomycetes bacterium]|nr:HAMP domain-containing histidine kinase [Planctomycetota bacterium]MBI3844603.1 HAMP domain-containing histidine kinase [Planctomycetota bacterium]
MRLRRKILIAIVATNALTFAALATSLTFDAARRRAEDESRHDAFIRSTTQRFSEKLLEVAGRVLDENQLVRDLLAIPLWSLARDAIVLNTDREKEYFISPLGARYRAPGLSATVARDRIREAIRDHRTILIGNGLAAPLDRSEESLWRSFGNAMRDLAVSVGRLLSLREEVPVLSGISPTASGAAPDGGSHLETATFVEHLRESWDAVTADGDVLVNAALAIGNPQSRVWGGIYLEPLAPDPPEYHPIPSLRSIFLIMAFGTSLIIVVTYVLLSSFVLRPLADLEEASRRVSRGDYSRPITMPSRDDEIAQLVASFNLMLRDVRDYHGHLQERIDEATDRRRSAEHRLVIAQRLAATGKLASGIAHEINNPLGGMINMSRALSRRDLSDEKRREYVALMIEGLERIQETVKKVLQFSPREVKPQIVDLGTVLDRAVGLVQHRLDRQHVALVREGPSAPVAVFGDPHELQQVFLNLVINALDAVGDVRRPGQITIGCRTSSGEVAVAIRDNGCGMTEEQRSQAFDLFYTTKPAGEGTGLGLSIVHNIVQNHGGRVELRSERGTGTTVEVTLPIASRAPEGSAA